jgi:hypothetical protein
MIIETLDERISLSGALRTNQWAAIRTVVFLLLGTYPEGVVLDCSGLRLVTEAGEMTFVEAIHEIEATDLPVLIAHLPHSLESAVARATEGRLYPHLSASFESTRIQEAISSPEWWDRLWGATER